MATISSIKVRCDGCGARLTMSDLTKDYEFPGDTIPEAGALTTRRGLLVELVTPCCHDTFEVVSIGTGRR